MSTKKIKYLKPSVDYLFKRIFGESETICAAFLNLIIYPDGKKQIKQVEFKGTELAKNQEEDKESRFDVRAVLDDGSHINIEMQIKGSKHYRSRMILYLAKLYDDELDEGDSFASLTPAIGVHVLGFNLLKGRKKVHSRFQFMDIETHEIFSDLMQLHVLELVKLKEKGYTDLEKWLWFIYDPTKAEEKGMAIGQPVLQEAYKRLEFLSQDKETRMAYEMRQKALRDIEDGRATEREEGVAEGLAKGLAKGREEGMAKGREEGVAKGREEGEYKKALEMANQMIQEEEPVSKIIKYTKLSKQEIETLQKSIKIKHKTPSTRSSRSKK